MVWDPVRYEGYRDERNRPFFDLVARIGAAAPARVVDLGCGTGTLTATLAQRWRAADIHGIDSSPQMLAQAPSGPGLRFDIGDIAEWDPAAEGPDIIVSNAALQWVPGHLDLLVSWTTQLAVGSWIAFQVPANFDAPSHALMREAANLPQWRDRLAGVLRHGDAVESTARYWEALTGVGCEVDAWDTTYLHVLEGEDPVLEWVRGTGLRPVLAALGPDDASQFETHYAAALRQAYPQTAGTTLFPFARRFVVAQKIRRA